ncbi:MAG: hypothetical protein ACLQFI_02315 [Methylocella sp.]
MAAAAMFPALQRFGREASIIGQLLTGYSALEYQLCMVAGMGGGDVEKAITKLFSKRGETRRVKLADGLGGAAYAAAGLGQEFATAIEDILLCVEIRNQYAHCIWHDDLTGRLAFAHMEEIAHQNGLGADTLNLTFFYVDVDLLQEQEAFFFYAKDNLNYLNYKRRQLVGDIGVGAILRVPTVAPRPRMHL